MSIDRRKFIRDSSLILSAGALGLAAFLWSLRNCQFEDLEGAGWRALDDEPPPSAHTRATPVAGDHPRSPSV